MIDNPAQVDRLMGKLQQALPLPARPTPELLAALVAKNAARKNAAFVSITHLRFDARLPLAREIIAYQPA